MNPSHLEPVTRAENMRRSPLVMAVMRERSLAAARKKMTRNHCYAGHVLSGNVRLTKKGRLCMECIRIGKLRRKEARK